ncbi:MAG: aspartyl/asparaginyl beta-hydroxylase [Candidatus Eremiobacteraeota bacterium]|nr:aspartyl/asparaginyl beta-hydroxylase [Candidatus Eremiobacteraeota bacterium]
MDTLGAANLNAWTPVRIRTEGTEPVVDWALVDRPFTEPFFEQTADRALQHPFNQVFAQSTSLDVLDAAHERYPGIAPAGFIFHMSRCGSTLISQMLSRLNSTIVLSEAQPIDALLARRGRDPDGGDETSIRRLRGLIGALSRPRHGERRLFVKFHAWHVLELPLILRAFPGVPWVFVFREPRAVLRSQMLTQGWEAVPGAVDPRYLGIAAGDWHGIPVEAYAARVLAAFCESALEHAERGRASFLEYTALPDGVSSRVLPFFGIAPDDGEAERMADVARLDSKAAGSEEYGARDLRAGPEIDRAAAEWLDGPYARLRAVAARAD